MRVAWCDRLGGTIQHGVNVPCASDIDYVRLLSERCEARPAGMPLGATRLIGRWACTDEPHRSAAPGLFSSAGRYPAWVGATWSFDTSTALPHID